MPRPPRSPLHRKRVVVLPDFYIDAVTSLPAWQQMAPAMQAIVARGGGNLPIGPIDFKVGGQAANVAVALARLGAKSSLVAQADELGRQMLAAVARQTRLDVAHVGPAPRSSATLALEMAGANLMLSHGGPLTRFGPRQVTAAAWRSIEAADAVVQTNWSQDRAGTALLASLARRLRGRATRLYLDTGDLRHRDPEDVARLLEQPSWRGVRAWSLNENELRAATGLEARGKAEAVRAARALAERLGTRLDLHTRAWAASVQADGRATLVAAPRDRAKRFTGAGDTWNAANVAGDLLGFDDKARLHLAHAVATRYVTRASGLPPGWRDVPAALWRQR